MFDQEHRAGVGNGSTTFGGARSGGGATTASLPARPSSELPQSAAPDVQDALAQQLQASAAANDFERDPFGLAHASSRGDGLAVAAQGAAPPPTSKVTGPELIVPKLIEFDDLEIGDRQRRETTLWNTGPSEARVIAADIAIDKHQKQFQLRKVPDRIMPSSSSVAAKSGEIAIDFVPQGEGLRTDTLHLTVRTIDASGAQRVFKIVLAGRGHQPGQPTHAEKSKREADTREHAENEAAAADREDSRIDRAKRNEKDPRVAPTGRLAAFNSRLEDIRDDIRSIDGKRAEGISIVEKEAAAFIRRQPPPTPSTWDYVREGAALALTFGSYGLAKGLSKAIFGGARMKSGPTGMGIGLGSDGQRERTSSGRPIIERSVEKALGKGAEWVIGNTVKPTPDDSHAATPPSGSTLSGDPSVAFFASQRIALGDSSRSRLSEITRLSPELVDQLHDDADFQEVVAVLDAVREELGTVAGTTAAETQSQATAAQWISFVSKRSGDTKKFDASESAIQAGTPHANLVSDLRPLDTRDGVIEISFSADMKDPQAPVRIVGVRVLGVAQDLAKRIRTLNVLEAQIPVRAVANHLTFGGQTLADPALAIARNEVGEITVAAGKPGELPETNRQARYLAAKHAPDRQNQRRDADVEAGGRRVVEEEIAPQWSDVLTKKDTLTKENEMPVRTDDASKPKL